jgi:Zn finger protein HypA/HybF involved in hydrogenase expression
MIDEQALVKRVYEVMKRQLGNTQGHLRKVLIHYDSSTDSFDSAKINELWQEIAIEPVFESSHIEIHAESPNGRCLLCNQDFELDSTTLRCPHCHCEQFKVIHDPPMIETYEMDEAAEPI